jgi:hypothetical protein
MSWDIGPHTNQANRLTRLFWGRQALISERAVYIAAGHKGSRKKPFGMK